MLKGVEGISFVQFDEKDVVRHTLVQRIVKAYEQYNVTVGTGRQLSLGFDSSAVPAENGNGRQEAAAVPLLPAPAVGEAPAAPLA